MKIALKICALLSINMSCYSMQVDWGKWYGDKEEQEVSSIGFDNDRVKVVKTGVSSRNLLLTDEGKIYINNMYPVISASHLQLVNVLREKQLIDDNCIDLLKTNPVWPKDPRPHVDAFSNFVSAVIIYLQVFQGIDQFNAALEAMQGAQQLFQKKDYKTLNAVKFYLKDRNKMISVWKFMHTEFLCVFHDYYSIRSKSFEGGPLSRSIISYYDMCEDCEHLMLWLLLNGVIGEVDTYEGNKGRSDYKILFASFNQYYDSRQRDGKSQLLKVVLKRS